MNGREMAGESSGSIRDQPKRFRVPFIAPVDLNFRSRKFTFLDRVEDFLCKNRKRRILKIWIIHIARYDLVVFPIR